MVDISENSIQTSLLCRISVANYRVNLEDTPEPVELTFSDDYRIIEYDGYDYLPLGNFVGITTSRSEIRGSGDSVTVTISGIPDDRVREIINSDIKGSFVRVYRGLYDPLDGDPELLEGTNVVGRFFGRVDTYNINEELNNLDLEGTFTINLECSSLVTVRNRFVNGRRTNPIDQKFLTNNQDVSFDRIPTLQQSNFVFGAPK